MSNKYNVWLARLPTKRPAPMAVNFSFNGSDGTWTLWIEAYCASGQWIRLLHNQEIDSSSRNIPIAEISNRNRVHCFLEQVHDHDNDADELAIQLIDMLWTLAREKKPPQKAREHLRWRLWQWICDERRRTDYAKAA
jgi:hypothetical protein